MGLNFVIEYHQAVTKKDIPQLPPEWKRKIKQAIENKLASYPEIFGKPLRQSLRGYRKLRVGDYRVIFRIEGKKVKIFVIRHRSAVYRTVENRK
ncbi:type II toxin-antitoxin system mRNA interferase toxin, RelE/StbE family [Patescibacteria group bacterium]|nr:type II toxin-antitoxin system mRNA interferase toxin, RelE/StbE family [Patescibacteria group bacterium]